MRCLGLLPLLVTLGCSSLAGPLPQAPLRDLPWGTSAADQAALAARLSLEAGDFTQAQAQLQLALHEQPQHIDAQRVRQDLLTRVGRTGLLRHELEQALAQAPDSPRLQYLAGRLAEDPAAKRAHFEQALRHDPHSFWPWLGLASAHSQHDRARAKDLYAALYAASGEHPLVAMVYGQVLREAEEPALALVIYQQLALDARLPGVGAIGMARALFDLHLPDLALEQLATGLRARPHDLAGHALLTRLLEAADPDGVRALRNALAAGEPPVDLARLVAQTPELFEPLFAGRPQAALALLQSMPAAATTGPLRVPLRRLLLQFGQWQRVGELLRADLPLAEIQRSDNALAPRFATLLAGPWWQPDYVLEANGCAQLAQALLATGLLAEAEALLDWATLNWGASPERRALADETSRELQFEAALLAILTHGVNGKQQVTCSEVLAELRRVSRHCFGRDVVGEQAIVSVPWVGEMLDPFHGDLVAHLARYNRLLLLGRQLGGDLGGQLYTRWVQRALPDDEAQPVPEGAQELLVGDRQPSQASPMIGSDPVGLALWNFYLVDWDQAREWQRGLIERRRLLAADGMAVLRDPLPQQTGDDTVDLSWRLLAGMPDDDAQLLAGTLAVVRAHERRHLVDARHYLPVEDHALRCLALVAEQGFSAAAVHAELERRAELAALALTPHTALVLAHIADVAAVADESSEHVRGFSQLLTELRAELQDLGISPERCQPSRWHELPSAWVRMAAARLWLRLPGLE